MSNLFITDFNIVKSAENLDRQRLFSCIYENIHGLASMLGCVDDLKLSDAAKKKAYNLKNKVQFKLWVDYEQFLLYYIVVYYSIWHKKYSKKEKFEETVNYYNILKIVEKMENLGIISGKRAHRDGFFISDIRKYVSWITHDLLNTHKSNLIRKEIERENKLKKDALTISCMYLNGNFNKDIYNKKCNNLTKKLSFHYRDIWPWCNPDIKMHFNWRDK